jgi:hypothetical protein
MKQGMFVLVLVLIAFTSLQAASHYGLSVNGFEPSAINLALGGSPVGVVNIWHNDPLNAYDNPAFPSLHEGFSRSSSRYDFFENHTSAGGSENLVFSSALASLSYKGIGLLFPFSHLTEGNYGSYADYGVYEFIDEYGNVTARVNIDDQINPYGLSINLPEAYKLFNSQGTLFPENTDIALGINHINNNSYIISSINPRPHADKTNASSNNIGLLARLEHTSKKAFQLESTLGMTYFNAFNADVSYIDSQQASRIYQRMNVGLALAGAQRNKYYNAGKGMLGSFENLYTIRVLGGTINEFASDPQIIGLGTELGLFDTLFQRVGYHYDDAGNIEGFTYGFGINLHYRNLLSATYNYASYPGGVITGKKHINSFAFSIDLIGLSKESARLRN